MAKPEDISLELILTALRRDRPTQILAAILLLGNALFPGVHVIQGLLLYFELSESGEWDTRFSPDKEWSYPEIFGYLQMLSVVMLLLEIHRRRKESAYLVWAVIFAIVLLDDSLGFHEMIGRLLSQDHGVTGILWLHGQSVGELAGWSFLALVIGLVFAFGLRRRSPSAWKVHFVFGTLLVLLAFFVVIVDALHNLSPSRFASGMFKTLEEGGEMLAISAILIVAFSTYRRSKGANGGMD